jgi:hypothetical protein
MCNSPTGNWAPYPLNSALFSASPVGGYYPGLMVMPDGSMLFAQVGVSLSSSSTVVCGHATNRLIINSSMHLSICMPSTTPTNWCTCMHMAVVLLTSPHPVAATDLGGADHQRHHRRHHWQDGAAASAGNSMSHLQTHTHTPAVVLALQSHGLCMPDASSACRR